jgi:hypothetical protein
VFTLVWAVAIGVLSVMVMASALAGCATAKRSDTVSATSRNWDELRRYAQGADYVTAKSTEDTGE